MIHESLVLLFLYKMYLWCRQHRRTMSFYISRMQVSQTATFCCLTKEVASQTTYPLFVHNVRATFSYKSRGQFLFKLFARKLAICKGQKDASIKNWEKHRVKKHATFCCCTMPRLLDFHPINLGQIQNTSSINYSLTRLVTRLQIYLRKPSKSHGPNWGNPRIARKEETRHTWMVLSTQGISMKLTTTHKYLLKDHFQNFTLPRKLFKEPLIHECEIKSKDLPNLLKQDIYKQ